MSRIPVSSQIPVGQSPVSQPLAAPFGAIARWRDAKALHPRGAVLDGTLHRRGLRPPAGVRWLDEVGDDPALVRLSRAAGLPAPLPDVLGLAVRVVPGGEGPYDLLLSSAFPAPGLRHVLRPGRNPLRGSYTSILPFSTPHGPLMLGAQGQPDGAFALCVATLAGQWRPFAVLDVGPRDRVRAALAAGADADVDFDPVRGAVPGLAVRGPVGRLRSGAYAASRRGRR